MEVRGNRSLSFAGVVMLLLLMGCTPSSVPARSEREPVPKAWEQHVSEIVELHQKTRKLQQEGKYAEAIPLSLRALELTEKALGPEHLNVATELAYLGVLYYIVGEFTKAEAMYLRALAVQEKVGRLEQREGAAFLLGLAAFYLNIGEYGKAESLYQRALAIQEKVLGPEHPDLALSLTGLGMLYSTIGDYAKAESLHQRAVTIAEKTLGPEHPGVATKLNNLAELYRVSGNYDKAKPLYQRALAIAEKALGPTHPSLVSSLNNLGLVCAATGEYTEAKTLHLRALTIVEKTLGSEHHKAGTIINNLAELYIKIGEYANAEALHQRALMIREKALGVEHPDVTQSLDNLAFLSATKRDFRTAVNLFKKGRRIQERQIQNVFAFTTEGQKLQFIQIISGAYYSYLSLIHQYLKADREVVRDGLELVLRRKGIVFDAQSRARNTLQGRMSEAVRKEWDQLSALRGDLARLLLNKPDKMSPEAYRETLASLQQQIETVEQHLASESALVAKELKQRSITVEAAAQALPKNSALVEFVKIQDFDFVKGEWAPSWRYLAFVLTAAGDVTLVDLGEASALEALAQRVFTDIKILLRTRGIEIMKAPCDRSVDPRGIEVVKAPCGRDASRQSAQLLQELYAQVWSPLEKALGKVEKIVLSPDGLLNLIPFAALVDSQGRSLVERYQLAYVTSGRELIGVEGALPRPDSDLLLVANPSFDQKGSDAGSQGTALRAREFRGVFTPLPGTERESREIPPLVVAPKEQKQVLVGERATETAVKAARSPRVLHLATHGFFLPDSDVDFDTVKLGGLPDRGITVVPRPTAKRYENPLVRSGLAFAGANHASTIAEGDDGILTALEITGMDLYGTELVVLSACDTGVGEVKTGEGVFGLRRAFALAGAKNLMMSLWPVSDEVTANQMKAFYQNLQKMPPAEALRQAQLDTIKQLKANSVYSGTAPPGLWAPFILQGAQALGQ